MTLGSAQVIQHDQAVACFALHSISVRKKRGEIGAREEREKERDDIPESQRVQRECCFD